MSIVFKDFKKKISKGTYLNLNFNFDIKGSLLIVDEDIKNLDIINDVFSKKTKYDGEILLFGENINNKLKKFMFSDYNIGFYNNFTIFENFKYLLNMYSVKLNKEELLNLFDIAEIDYRVKYHSLDKESKYRTIILFNYLVSKELLLIYLYKVKDFYRYKRFYNYIIKNHSMYNKKRILIVLSDNVNSINNDLDKSLIISDNKIVYYDYINKLNVVKDLIILETDNFDYSSIKNDIDVQIEIMKNKIILKKNDMENVLYYLLKNNINIISINDFNDSTNLYFKE